MSAPLNIVFLASEGVPFVKTGGLADVVGALPKALQDLGHQVRIILPKYSKIDAAKFGMERFQESMGVWMGGGVQEWCAVDVAYIEGDIPVYFIENWKFYERDGIYNDANNRDFNDNPERYAFFTRAALQLCIDQQWPTDIVHSHDWQTALAPGYLKTWFRNEPILSRAAGIFTIHNIQYQGNFPKTRWPYIGLGWENFTSDKYEDHDRINYLKGGIAFADMVNTVSPTYAFETKSSELGMGMNNQLNAKGDAYVGILNGVDYADWNPATDKYLPANYSPEDMAGKAECKRALQEMFGLEVNPDIPLVGVVSRFADQKGLDLLYGAIHGAVNRMKVQFIILGSGDKQLETAYMQLPAQYPGRIGTLIGYDNPKAHLIEAGSDFFAMPSRFEPCGLNQMYSLKYGTLPIVRATGGLADTVVQYNEQTGEGTGFKYTDNTPSAIVDVIGWAVSTFYDRKIHLDAMIQRAMTQDFGWLQSARQYETMYREALRRKG
ncbi:MAG: glycogen synthase GlgA [Lewinella sp.]|uniref:glycogen synthase GlgA n=1 Tax=Lewinella sp. TaxID=2004506 RepID=UPI003D6BB208